MMRFVPVTASGDFTAISCATFPTASNMAAVSGKERVTKPMRSASAPPIVRAVSANSRAAPAKTSHFHQGGRIQYLLTGTDC